MDILYYYFVKSAVDDSPREDPIYSNSYLGEIGDSIIEDGVGYIITNYVVETADTEPEGDSLYW